MSAGEGKLAFGPYRIGEKRAGTASFDVYDAADPRRPEIRVRVVVMAASPVAEVGRVIEQTRRYALGTPALATATHADELTLPGGETRIALAFELGPGRTLDELMISPDAADIRRALEVIERAARALSVLHDQGIAHGSVLPALIAADSQERLVLGGYGVAQLAAPAGNDPRSDGVALRSLARDWLLGVAPGLGESAEITRQLEQPGNDVVGWASALGSAVRAELAKSPQPQRSSEPQPPPAVVMSAPVEVSRTPPAVVVAPPPPPAPRTAAAGQTSRAGSWAIGAALGLALLLLVGVGVGLFAHSIFVSKRGKAPEASGAVSVASATGAPSAPPQATPSSPVAPSQPSPAVPAPPQAEPHAKAPEASQPPRGVRRGAEAPESDAEAAVPVTPATPAKAAPDALVTAVIFGDLECPHTRSAYQTLSELERLFPGDLRIAWRHRPLREHGHARDAAVFAAALHSEEGSTAFWRLVGDVSKSDGAASREFLESWASRQERGFRPPTDLAAASARVDEDLGLANRFGVRETPTLFINGLRVRGDRPLDELRGLVARELREARALVSAGVSASFIYTTRVTKNLIGIGPEAPERTCPPLEKSPRRGAVRALLTMVVFSDYECPFCRRMHPALKRLEAKYAGELLVVWKNLPLAQHPNAASAARLALGARAAGGDASFWLVHDRLFEADSPLDTATLEGVARGAGVDARSLMEAVRRGDHQSEIDDDVALARRLGVAGTPTIFLNGRRLGGARPFSSIESLVSEELQMAERLVGRGIKRDKLYATLCGEPD